MDSDIISGPAVVVWGGQNLFSAGDIVVRKVVGTWEPASSMFGPLGKRLSSIHYEISFTPCGVLTAAQLAVLYPFTAANVGTSIYTAANVPLVIWTLAGKKYTFTRAGLAKPPSVRLSANSTAFGDMTFYAVLGLGRAITDADAFVAITAVTFAVATFDDANVLSPGYLGTWGSYESFEVEDGFHVEETLSLQALSADRLGIFSHRITGIDVTARFKPVSLSEDDYLAFSQHGGSDVIVPGQPFGNAAEDLTILGSPVQLVLKDVGPADAGFAFGAAARAGEMVMHGKHTFAVGVPAAPLTWTIS